MKIRDCMTAHVVCVGAGEPAETAARLMARYNLGLLPVRGADGRMCGVVTDRDLVLRCMAAGQEAGKLPVARAMSNRACPCRRTTRPSGRCGRWRASVCGGCRSWRVESSSGWSRWAILRGSGRMRWRPENASARSARRCGGWMGKMF